MYEQHVMKIMNAELSMEMTIKKSTMKYGWHQMSNKTVQYYQTPYNIALIA